MRIKLHGITMWFSYLTSDTHTSFLLSILSALWPLSLTCLCSRSSSSAWL